MKNRREVILLKKLTVLLLAALTAVQFTVILLQVL